MLKLETILIVEDDPNDIFSLKRIFRKKGVLNPLQFVGSGEEAVAYLSGKEMYSNRAEYPYPILMLLDLKMKGMSGWDVLEWLKTQSTQPAEVAVLTGINMAEITQAYQLGTHHFLFKPLNFSEFVNLVSTFDSIIINQSPSGCYLEALAVGKV